MREAVLPVRDSLAETIRVEIAKICVKQAELIGEYRKDCEKGMSDVSLGLEGLTETVEGEMRASLIAEDLERKLFWLRKWFSGALVVSWILFVVVAMGLIR